MLIFHFLDEDIDVQAHIYVFICQSRKHSSQDVVCTLSQPEICPSSCWDLTSGSKELSEPRCPQDDDTQHFS